MTMTQTRSKSRPEVMDPSQSGPKSCDKPNRSASRQREPVPVPPKPVLRFSPTAWAKLVFFRDHDQVEVGGFGITAADDLLFVENFVTVRQEVTVASIEFDDNAVADFFDTQAGAGRKPEQFGRLWIHSHPGQSPEPSVTDVQTFARVFGGCQWAVLFIVGRTGKTHARLRFNVGPGGEAVIPVEINFSRPFGASDHEAWEAEYRANILPAEWEVPVVGHHERTAATDFGSYSLADDLLEDLQAMEPEEREYVLQEMAARPDLWGQEHERLHDDEFCALQQAT